MADNTNGSPVVTPFGTMPTGTLDGIAPVYLSKEPWRVWGIGDIFFGEVGNARYIPKLNDYVVNPETDQWFKVIAVDLTTGLSTLSPINNVPTSGFDSTDVLTAIAAGNAAENYRCFIDNSVIPALVTVDNRFFIRGSESQKAMIFLGINLSKTAGKVISCLYDTSGNLISNEIPLETIEADNAGNPMAKVVKTCNTTETIPDNQVLTLVTYGTNGQPTRIQQMLAYNTDFIRTPDASTKYVMKIALETSFLSSADPKLIVFPINVNKNGLNLMLRVYYSDGSTILLPIDGSRVIVEGLDDYVSTIPGMANFQQFPITVTYNLAPGEYAYGTGENGYGKFFLEVYKGTTLAYDPSYSMRLFGYPVWIDATSGYKLRWFLYSLKRDIAYDVTPFVYYNASMPGFSPTAYGMQQTLSVSLNLRDVNGAMPDYVYTQVENITLLAPGTARTSNWKINFLPNSPSTYGVGLSAAVTFVNQNLNRVNLTNGFSTKEEWLAALYYNTQPLFNPNKEPGVAPAPDTFKIVTASNEYEFPIAQWNQTLTVAETIPNNSTLYIKFIQKLADNDAQLSVAGLPVYQSIGS